jgi:hypothetical protein
MMVNELWRGESLVSKAVLAASNSWLLRTDFDRELTLIIELQHMHAGLGLECGSCGREGAAHSAAVTPA